MQPDHGENLSLHGLMRSQEEKKMELQESQKAWMQVVARACSDELFKKRLLADPYPVLPACLLGQPSF